jgi:hypothetical protein
VCWFSVGLARRASVFRLDRASDCAPGSAARETGRSPSSTSSSVARHSALGRVTGSGVARLSCAGSCNLILRPFFFRQNWPSFRDLMVTLLLRRKGLRNPSLFTVCSRAARQSPPGAAPGGPPPARDRVERRCRQRLNTWHGPCLLLSRWSCGRRVAARGGAARSMSRWEGV